MAAKDITPGHGYILVEIPPVIDSINFGKSKLYVDTSFSPEKYANVFGTVVSVCSRLTTKSMQADPNRKGIISEDTEIRLLPGDTIFYHYLSIKNAQKQYNRGSYFEEDGKRYMLLPYSAIFFAIRKKAIDVATAKPLVEDKEEKAPKTLAHHIFEPFSKKAMEKFTEDWANIVKPKEDYVMVNDWLLIEPIRKGQHVEYIKGMGNVIIDDELSGANIAVVTDNPYRASEGIVKATPPNTGLQVGDRIVFEKESDVPVEYDLTRTLDMPYFRMQMKDIIAKRDDKTVQLVKDYTLIVREDEKEETAGGFYIPEISQVKPFIGEIKMIGPDCKDVIEGQRVYFEVGGYTEFPWGDGQVGSLVPERKIQMIVS